MAYVVLGCLNIFLGIVSTVSTYILESFPDEEELRTISEKLKKVKIYLIYEIFNIQLILI